jgi:Tol biopolymer transport system component
MERWQQIESLFQEALRRPIGDRDAWLREACASDAELQREVASLLENHHASVSTGPWAAAAAQLIVKPVLLEPGRHLGPYQIVAFLAAGGMGEVYRARDTKLKRDVALKVLPEAFARDPGRMARFQREAEVLASLNHPNIAHIYGVEERALVMELVEGESPKGPMPVEEAGRVALQMADALEYAHEKGVVHRDLKPANIKITSGGTVKLLDFGLAKAFATESELPTHREDSPTLTIGGTEAGVILGTAAYMSPEQASGKPVDKRTDIWSYGVVLWELLTGERLFNGETVSHTLADVLRAPIDFGRLPGGTPAPIRNLLGRCLDRDVRSRLRDVGEARVAIQGYLTNPSVAADSSEARSAARAPLGRRLLPWGLAGVLFAVAVVFFALWFVRPTPSRLVSQFAVEEPPDASFVNGSAGVAVSPDGHYVVFGAAKGSDSPSLWLRPLDSLEARPLPGTERANFPFWSPDSKSVAFLAGSKLKRVDLQGGAPLVLCDTSESNPVLAVGGTWNRDGVILFGGTAGLRRVLASGGEPILLTKADASRGEAGHSFPQFLPDGKRFLYFIRSGDARVEGVYAASLEHPEERVQVLRTDTKALYAQPGRAGPGYLLWVRDPTLFAQRIDPGNLRLEGEPVPVVQNVGVNAIRRAAFWASDAGLLVYRRATPGGLKMAWFDRDGKRVDLFEPIGIGGLRLSPGGERAAFTQPRSTLNLWLIEFSRSVVTRLTFSNDDSSPAWSPDGRQIAFSSSRSGTFQIYRKDANGGGQEEQLSRGPNNKRVSDWSSDGKFLLYMEDNPKTGVDLGALPLDGDRKPLPLLQTGFEERKGQFSPDGKWIAYESNESGVFEVYVRAFPSSTGKWQISNRGGTNPRWRRDGKELFYLSPDGKMIAATLQTPAAGVRVEGLRELFSVSVPPPMVRSFPYDVTADGQRFLLTVQPTDRASIPPLTVVTNWDAGLKK